MTSEQRRKVIYAVIWGIVGPTLLIGPPWAQVIGAWVFSIGFVIALVMAVLL